MTERPFRVFRVRPSSNGEIVMDSLTTTHELKETINAKNMADALHQWRRQSNDDCIGDILVCQDHAAWLIRSSCLAYIGNYYVHDVAEGDLKLG